MSLLAKTHQDGERIVAVFPCIGGEGDPHHSYVVDAHVVTIDEWSRRFTVRMVNADGTTKAVKHNHNTLPRALREARQWLGWG